MNKLSLTTRLALLLSLPLIGIATFGIQGAWTKFNVARDYARLRTSGAVLNQFGNVIHELQRERGRAAVFIGRKGAKFATEYPAQQKVTDATLRALHELLPSLDATGFGAEFEARLKTALTAVAELPAKRAAATEFTITSAESTTYFTNTIALLLHLLVDLSNQVSDAKIAHGIGSYVYYLEAKEQVGIERAVLSGVFSADKFAGDAFARFSQAVAAQSTYFRVFRDKATSAQGKSATDTVRGAAVDATAAMRQTALEKASTGGFGVDSAAWFDAITAKIELMKQVEDRLAVDFRGEAQRIETTAQRALVTYAGATLAIIVVTALFGIWVIRSIARPLKRVISELTANADQTTSAAGQVSGSSQSLAEGSSEQASSLEETSAALEEMSSMTKRNADSAHQAKELSTQTRASADRGSAHMDEMRRAMDAIKSSSNDVGKIIKTIDEIAFQTNILALNAAVEAARAGEAGLGFAVVAEEVRNLAQRSAQSAKETAEKIEDAIRKSEHGVEISRSVADSLAEIVDKARKVDGLVGEIATASKEQSQGIGQLNTTLSQLDRITQSNASNAEETAAAAEELTAQASAMRGTVTSLEEIAQGRKTRKGNVASEPEAEAPAALKPSARNARRADGTTKPSKQPELSFSDYETTVKVEHSRPDAN